MNSLTDTLINKYIFTPGPVRIYPETLEIGALQTPYFRNKEFSELVFECENNLLNIVNAPKGSRVIFLTASGTAGMESVVQNLLSSNKKTLIINGGGFGQRFVKICQIHGVNYQEHPVNNTNLSNTQALEAHQDIDSLLINGHETTIGTLYDLEAVGAYCKANNILHIVDAISLFVTDELDMQKQNIDVAIISSHKGLALPPGLSMVILSPDAIEKVKPENNLYFDFNTYLQNGLRGQTPFTPAVTILLQLQARLRQINNDSIDYHINKAKEVAEYFRESISKLPLKPFSQFMPNAMTTLTSTDGQSAEKIVKILDAKYQVIVAPNGGDLRDKIFRVSHMGNMDKDYMDILINALFDYYGMSR